MTFVELSRANVIEDSGGKLWLPIGDLGHDQIAGDKPELIRIGDDYYDVLGYSMQRRCFWIKRIDPSQEAEDFVSRWDTLDEQEL